MHKGELMSTENPYQSPKSEVVSNSSEDDENIRKGKSLATIIYAFQASGILLIFPFIIALLMNYLKLSSVKDTWIESHFRWQMRTFWFSLLWGVLTIVSIVIPIIHWFIPLFLAANVIWVLYRIIRGWVMLSKYQVAYAN